MRSSIQPLRRNSGLQRRTENLVLYLKYENNFDDSSYWNQKVTGHNPSVVATATKAISLPTFDNSTYDNYGVFDAGGKVSAMFGLGQSADYAKLGADLTSGRLIESNSKTWDNQDSVNNAGDPFWENVALLMQRRSGYGEGAASHIYKNAANTLQSTHASLEITETDSLPNPHLAGKFDDFAFEFGSPLDGTSLKYVNNATDAEFNFSDSDFTIEFWVKPTTISSDRRSGGTRSELKTKMDHVILASKCFVVGYDYAYGFVACFPNGDSSTSAAYPDVIVTSTDVSGAGADHAGDWRHVAVSKKGNLIFLFIDGVLKSDTTYGVSKDWDGKISTSGNGYTSSVSVGKDLYGITSSDYARGYVGGLDNLRITKGVCRYDNFPRLGLSDYPDKHSNNVVLKIISETSDGSETIADTSPSPKTITKMPGLTGGGGTLGYSSHEVKHSNSTVKFGTTALSFDHKNEYDNHHYPVVGVNWVDSQSDPDRESISSDWDWNDKEWTIDLWVNPTESLPGKSHVILSKWRNIDTSLYANHSGNVGEWILYHRNGYLVFYYKQGEHCSSWTSKIVTNQWQHIAVQCNHNATYYGRKYDQPMVQMYVNGELCGLGQEYKAVDNAGAAIPDSLKNNVVVGSYGLSPALLGYANVSQSRSEIPFKGFMEDVRVTKGVARYSENSVLPTTNYENFATAESTLRLYYELQGHDGYLVKKESINETSKFKTITTDVDSGYDYCRIKSGDTDQSETIWSVKENVPLRMYANDDFIIYGMTEQSQETDERISKIRIYTINRTPDGTNSCNIDQYRDITISNHEIYGYQLAFDGEFYYIFSRSLSNQQEYLHVYKSKKDTDSSQKVFYDLELVSSTLIFDPLGYGGSGYTSSTYRNKQNRLVGFASGYALNSTQKWYTSPHQSLAIKKNGVRYLYTWAIVADGDGFGNWGRRNDTLKNAYSDVKQTTFNLQRHEISEDGLTVSTDAESTPPVKVYNCRSADYPLPVHNTYHSHIFSDGKDVIFVLDYEQSSRSLDPDAVYAKPPVDQFLTVLTIDESGDLVATDKVSVNQWGIPRASMKNTFYHKGHVYVGAEDNGSIAGYKYGSDVYKVVKDSSNNISLEVVSKGSSTNFSASYGVGEYIYGWQGTDDSYSRSYRDTFGASNQYPHTNNPQAILISGSGVYSNGPTIDSAQQLNLEGDFTIEGSVLFSSIPKGTDDDPGATIFDFGNTKLTNTSGFWTMHGPEVNSANGTEYTDYFDPDHVDEKSNKYMLNRFIHFAVQRRDTDLELWMDVLDEHGNESFSLVAEDKSAIGIVSGVTGAPYNSVRSIGASVSGTNFFTGHMDNFKVWDKAVYGPMDVQLGGPYADGIFTSRDSNPIYFLYYYYNQLRSWRSNWGWYSRGIYGTKNIHMYEGQNIDMWCTAQSLYDPRYSVLRTLPVTIHWYKSLSYGGLPGAAFGPSYGYRGYEYIGSSDQGRSVHVPQFKCWINSQGKGEASFRRLEQKDSGYYYAIVAIGPPDRPKYIYRWPHPLARVLLTVSPWPEPPPPPKAVFQMFSCNTIGHPSFPTTPPTDIRLLADGFNSTVVELGEDAQLLASFYPLNLGWENLYNSADICTEGPYSFVWYNKGRGSQADRSIVFGPGLALRKGPWPSTALNFKNIRKGIKGPIEVEAFDSNGVSYGKASCAGITLRLPNLLPILTRVPSYPDQSDANWNVVDYRQTQSYRYGIWERNRIYYNTYAYEINGKFNVTEADVTLKPLAYDPNAPELVTGGIEYKWKIVGVDEGSTVVNIADGSYGDVTSALYTISENFRGTVTVEMQYKNYPAGQSTADPEGRLQVGKKTVVHWVINLAECFEPYLSVFQAQMTSLGWYVPNINSNSRYTNEIIRKLGDGKEEVSGEMTVYFAPCQEWVLPIGYLKNWAWRLPFATQVALYYARGFTNTLTFDNNIWDDVTYTGRTSGYTQSWWVAAQSMDYAFFKKKLYKNHDGTTTNIKLTNDCGEKNIKVTFKLAPSWRGPAVGPSDYSFVFYKRTLLRYTWWGWGIAADQVPTETVQHLPEYTFISGSAHYLGACKRWRVRVNGAVVKNWTSDTKIPVLGTTLHIDERWRNLYWSAHIVDPATNLTLNGVKTLQIDFATDPSLVGGSPDWDNATIVTSTYRLFYKELPTITSWGWGWGWWYWGYYYWGYRMSRVFRPYWYWYPYYWYRPYGRTSWGRVYNYYQAPRYSRRTYARGYSLRISTVRRAAYTRVSWR